MKRIAWILILVFAFAGAAFAGSDCHGAKTEKSASTEHSCDGHGEQHASCPIKGKKVAGSEEVTVDGKLLCRHCNLHETQTCEKVFQPEGAEGRYAVCLGGNVKQAESAGAYGAATITVTGKLVTAEDGTRMLKIESAKKKS